MEKAARAYEDLEERENHLETATAEFEARTKALDQREKKLKDEVAGIAGERTETKAIWKNLEAERERVSRKEATFESLIERTLGKEREALVNEKEKVRAAAADLKGKGKATERERIRLQALGRDLETLKTRLDNRERAIKGQEAELERRRQEVRRMREKIQELL